MSTSFQYDLPLNTEPTALSGRLRKQFHLSNTDFFIAPQIGKLYIKKKLSIDNIKLDYEPYIDSSGQRAYKPVQVDSSWIDQLRPQNTALPALHRGQAVRILTGPCAFFCGTVQQLPPSRGSIIRVLIPMISKTITALCTRPQLHPLVNVANPVFWYCGE